MFIAEVTQELLEGSSAVAIRPLMFGNLDDEHGLGLNQRLPSSLKYKKLTPLHVYLDQINPTDIMFAETEAIVSTVTSTHLASAAGGAASFGRNSEDKNRAFAAPLYLTTQAECTSRANTGLFQCCGAGEESNFVFCRP
jgi:hypothetical protein